MDYKQLQKEYTAFNYRSYSYEIIGKELKLAFVYELCGIRTIPFTHKVSYQLQGEVDFGFDNVESFDNFIFHIGLVETINYWKLACPRDLNIYCGRLDANQKSWWKKLYYHGLGEFIYLNNMADLVTEEDFINIVNKDTSLDYNNLPYKQGKDYKGNLIPVGGGKDSVVSLQVLREDARINLPFVMSPPIAAYDCIKVATYKGYLEAKRIFDQRMMAMNSQGFLNGHVPFSAILAFIAVLGAALTGRRYIPLSNEKSANEPSVIGTSFNHQYSKSFEFEEDFDRYLHANVTTKIEYFSLLRPLYEIEIGQMFAHYQHYHHVYRSCNRGKKENAWCGQCPKCLFVYIILSPFVKRQDLIDQFGKDMLDDLELKSIFDELIGCAKTKPFECVGTIWEVRHAINLTLKEYDDAALLTYYKSIGGPSLEDQPIDYEEGDLLPESHRRILLREMKNLGIN